MMDDNVVVGRYDKAQNGKPLTFGFLGLFQLLPI